MKTFSSLLQFVVCQLTTNLEKVSIATNDDKTPLSTRTTVVKAVKHRERDREKKKKIK